MQMYAHEFIFCKFMHELKLIFCKVAYCLTYSADVILSPSVRVSVQNWQFIQHTDRLKTARGQIMLIMGGYGGYLIHFLQPQAAPALAVTLVPA